MSQVVVCALYKFVTLDNYQEIRQPLLEVMLAQQVRGTLLLAREGINGTVAGSQAGIDALLAWLATQPGLEQIVCKFSFDDAMPFNHNYGSLMNCAEEVDRTFPALLNKRIRSLDSIFGICSLDHYHHGTPLAADAEQALAICGDLVSHFSAQGLLLPPADPF